MGVFYTLLMIKELALEDSGGISRIHENAA